MIDKYGILLIVVSVLSGLAVVFGGASLAVALESKEIAAAAAWAPYEYLVSGNCLYQTL